MLLPCGWGEAALGVKLTALQSVPRLKPIVVVVSEKPSSARVAWTITFHWPTWRPVVFQAKLPAGLQSCPTVQFCEGSRSRKRYSAGAPQPAARPVKLTVAPGAWGDGEPGFRPTEVQGLPAMTEYAVEADASMAESP